MVSVNIHPRVEVSVKTSSTLNITNSSLFKMADILPRFDKRSLTRRALNWNPSVDLSRSIDQGKRERRRENIGWLYWLCVNIFERRKEMVIRCWPFKTQLHKVMSERIENLRQYSRRIVVLRKLDKGFMKSSRCVKEDETRGMDRGYGNYYQGTYWISETMKIGILLGAKCHL